MSPDTPWFEHHAGDLAQRSSAAQAQRALSSVSQLNRKDALTLDLVMQSWALTALCRPDDIEQTLEIHALASDAIEFLPNTQEFSDFKFRWSVLADLLEGKRQASISRASAPKLAREDEIFALLAAKPQTQAEIAKALKLSAGRITQLLDVLEERGKVSRQKTGRDVKVSLGVSRLVVMAPTPAVESNVEESSLVERLLANH
jgi:predicted Rossmann fold nucleotide-binding protein DprA/Smf involved in DNA uptake